jgi:hypothetical protein
MTHVSIIFLFSYLYLFNVVVHVTEAYSVIRASSKSLSAMSMTTRPSSRLFMTTEQHRRMGELTKPEQTVYDVLLEVVKSGYSFRVVVVGKGAILESTVPCLGPVIKLTQSPSTGTFVCKKEAADC